MRKGSAKLITAGIAALAASPAHAQLTVAPDSGDTGWVLAASAIALAAIVGGLALRHAGLVESRRAPTEAFAPVAIAAAVPLLWIVIGYSLAFGPGSGLIGGLGNLLLGGLPDIREGATISESAFAFFQIALAVAAPAFIAGAVAGRARAGWTVCFALVWSLLVFVPVSRWVSAGWLTGLGALDYAGGIGLHLSVGASALTAAWMMGPRTGFRRSALPPVPSPTMVLIGTGLVWLGLLAVAGGSAFAASDDAARAIINAHAAAGAGALVWLGLDTLQKRSGPLGFASGAIAGLAASAAAGAFAGPVGAALAGAVGALLARAAHGVFTNLRIDDPAQVAALNAVGGAAGALLLPVMMMPLLGAPVFEDAAPFISLAIAQAVAVVAVLLWSIVGTLIAGYTISMIVPMRDDEQAG